MHIGITYLATFIVIVISSVITLFFKYELEQLFREKKSVGAFHIANLGFTFMASMGTFAVMTIYVTGGEFKFFKHTALLMLAILPIYLLGHFMFEKYKVKYQRYRTTENEKVVVLNQKFLQKKRSAKFPVYNAAGKEDKPGKNDPSRRRHQRK